MERMSRIGIFYDGNFFFHVSNYYQYHHERHARLKIDGLHKFITDKVADAEGSESRYCQIVDAHYFRGRPHAADADDDALRRERIFDDVLVRQNIASHYLPLSNTGEKGIDVWLALEAYERASRGQFDVAVLIACDGDFQPLLRKLKGINCRSMVLGWDFKFTDRNGNPRETRTAQTLLSEANYPILMDKLIEDRTNMEEMKSLFYERDPNRDRPDRPDRPILSTTTVLETNGELHVGTVQNIKDGYGFLNTDKFEKPVFFYSGDCTADCWRMLRMGDRVEFEMGRNDKGPCAVRVRPAAATQAAASA